MEKGRDERERRRGRITGEQESARRERVRRDGNRERSKGNLGDE